MTILAAILKFFLTDKAGRIVGGVILAVLVGFGIKQKVHNDGVSEERQRNEAKAVQDALAARKIERDAAPCIADVNCVLPDPFRMPRVQPDQGK